MKGLRVASRYASSLLDLALEQKKEDAIAQDMETILKTIEDSHDFEVFLASPVVPASKKASILADIFKDKVDDLTLRYLDLVAKSRRENILEVLAKEFISQYKAHKNILVAEVISAAKIDATIEKSLKEKIRAIHSGEIEMKNQVDESLIGGFILRIGDQQVDASIARKLSDLKKVFNAN